MTFALGAIILVSFLGWVFLARWIADVRDLLLSVKHRVDKHHEALGIQLEFNRSVEDHLERLDGHTGASRPFCVEMSCSTTVGIQGARCSKCIRRLKANDPCSAKAAATNDKGPER